MDGTLLGATTPGQSRSESDANEGVLRILQSSSITKASQLDCLVSYPGLIFFGWGGLHFCREAVYVFYSPSQLDKHSNTWNHLTVCKWMHIF